MRKHDTHVIIETIAMGRMLKVSAIDPVTGTEVSIIADAKAPREQREKLAIRKLDYVIRKKQPASSSPQNGILC